MKLAIYSTYYTPYRNWRGWKLIYVIDKNDNNDFKKPLFLLQQSELTTKVYKYRSDYADNRTRADGYIEPYPQTGNTALFEENLILSDFKRTDQEVLELLENLNIQK